MYFFLSPEKRRALVFERVAKCLNFVCSKLHNLLCKAYLPGWFFGQLFQYRLTPDLTELFDCLIADRSFGE